MRELLANGRIMVESTDKIFDVEYKDYKIKDRLPGCINLKTNDIFILINHCKVNAWKVSTVYV